MLFPGRAVVSAGQVWMQTLLAELLLCHVSEAFTPYLLVFTSAWKWQDAVRAFILCEPVKDKNYSWQGGASSIQRVVGAKWSDGTHFLFPFKLGGRESTRNFQPHLPSLGRHLAWLRELLVAWSALSPCRAATAPNRETRSNQWRCSWSIVGTQHKRR